MSRRFPIFMVSALFLVLSLAGCEDREPPSPLPPRPVVAMIVEPPSMGAARTFSGAAKAAIETNLSFRVEGEIMALPAKVGMKVKRGDLIARLDPIDYQLQVREAEATMADALATHGRLEADYMRQKALYKSRTISKSELDAAEASYHSMQARVNAARKRVELARRRLKYTVLEAPVEGDVAQVPVEVHQTVAPGATVAVLAAKGEMEFEVGVPEKLIGYIEPGAEARVSFDALGGRAFNATVVKVGVESRSLSVFPVTLRLEGDHKGVLTGMIGEARFRFREEADQAAFLPPEAVAGTPSGQSVVWVVDPEIMTVSSRKIKVGGFTPQGVAVQSGIEPGEMVVTRGVHRLEEGQKVRVLKGLD